MRGECVLIVGKNGAGKSTFLKLLNGILRPSAGTLKFDDMDTSNLATSKFASFVSITFQNPGDQLFASTVEEEIGFGTYNLNRNNPEHLITSALKLFKLERFRSAHPYDLSVAQRKLLTLASAAATGCPILGFDEPSANLSQPERITLSDAIKQLLGENRTILIVSHDFDVFFPLCNRVVVLGEGKFIFTGSGKEFISQASTFRKYEVRLSPSQRISRLLILPPPSDLT
jgi:energy-coupling factor transport system ATP-binding protein